MSTMYHSCVSIEGLLKLSDSQLAMLFKIDGSAVREQLIVKAAGGEEVIPSSKECEGFDPVKACPGHEHVEK